MGLYFTHIALHCTARKKLESRERVHAVEGNLKAYYPEPDLLCLGRRSLNGTLPHQETRKRPLKGHRHP